jgi:phytoene desaturase
MDKPVVIIGAGIGGLSAAIHLAAAGRRVVVYEKNAAVGGKMAEVRQDGFRWDTGPSVITMRHVFEELFATAGRRLDDYLTLLPVEPLTRYFYPDGVQIDVTRSWPRMAEQIERLDAHDVEGYLRYLAYAASLHRITGPVFIYDQPPHLGSIAQVALPDMIKVDPLRTMDQAIRGFVRSPHLHQLLGRFATYVGASPFRAPATLNVIAHVELTGGVWYPQGGIYAIARALERLAGELGVEIHTDCGVEEVLDTHDQVYGVRLSSGATVPCTAVIANVDVATVYERLLHHRSSAPALKRLSKQEPSCSGFIMMLGVEGADPRLAHHNIFFSRDYPTEFDDIFLRGIPPRDPTIYVAITSKTDRDGAPDGCENWFVLVNAPALGSQFDWEDGAAAYRNLVLERLAALGFDIRDRIRSTQILTPIDIERMTGARRGALYGASSNNRFAAFLRPHNRAEGINGLYFAGGTTHPGGGVPMVTLSGRVAANLVMQDGY